MPDDPIEIVIPGEPKAKGRARVTVIAGRPRQYPDKKTEIYENLVRLAAEKAMDGRSPVDCAVKMIVVAVLPVPGSWSGRRQRMAIAGHILPAKLPDLDNLVKAATDGCNKVVYRDDRLIVGMEAMKIYGERPRLEIRVETVGENTSFASPRLDLGGN